MFLFIIIFFFCIMIALSSNLLILNIFIHLCHILLKNTIEITFSYYGKSTFCKNIVQKTLRATTMGVAKNGVPNAIL